MFKMILVLLLSVSVTAVAGSFPKNPTTQGVVCSKTDKHFDRLRYIEKMPYCKRAVSKSLKQKTYARYGIEYEDRYHYTVDHIIPLSIGGSNHPDNLWPEHLSLKCKRGNLEFSLYREVETGKMKSDKAREIILKSKLK